MIQRIIIAATAFVLLSIILLVMISGKVPVVINIDGNSATKGQDASDKKTLTINGVDYTFRWCPPDTFKMGSPESEKGRHRSETQHEVTLTKGFWILETEVTQEMWKSVRGNNPSKFKKGGKYPVENINWADCQKFCKKLNNNDKGLYFSLPTEAQWEYACRAGTTSALNNGKELTSTVECPNLNEVAWYGVNHDCSTHEVGTKKPNAWGLYDMHGNVFELCNAWFNDYPSGPQTDPTGGDSGSYRVIRGGSWYCVGAKDCRSAFRGVGLSEGRGGNRGFRLLLSSTN